MIRNTPERFWARVSRGEGCWEWQGPLARRGYGKTHYQGKDIHAHRLAWIFENGPIEGDLFVCHHCDNPRCVRPSHLFLGTAQDNLRDAQAKGRLPTVLKAGASHPKAKLTVEDTALIRKLHADGATRAQIARAVRISASTVDIVLEGRHWTSKVQAG